jgi:hypothetical protein
MIFEPIEIRSINRFKHLEPVVHRFVRRFNLAGTFHVRLPEANENVEVRIRGDTARAKRKKHQRKQDGFEFHSSSLDMPKVRGNLQLVCYEGKHLPIKRQSLPG